MKPFTVKRKKYRVVSGLLVDELQVKKGSRYEHVAYVRGKQDALDVIHDRPRSALNKNN